MIQAASQPVPCGSCVSRALNSFPDLSFIHSAWPERYPHLLESVAHGTEQGRFDILFAFPADDLTLDYDGRLASSGAAINDTDFLGALDCAWRAKAERHNPAIDVPFRGGWFVYLGYELAHSIEPTVPAIPSDTELPVAAAVRIPAAIIRDHRKRLTYAICEADTAADYIPLLVQDIENALQATGEFDWPPLYSLVEDPAENYLDAIAKALGYIRAGDVFQVNLSRAWRAEFRAAPDPVVLYRRLRTANPAPFAGLMSLGGGRAIVSSSPERLVSVRGRRICTRPIAGTYPRSSDHAEDLAWSRELLRHPKERAEHVMLLDLERNDLGRVCRPGSVQVSQMMVLESYRHVHHIVSEVSGELESAASPAQVLRAIFPGGTITGCPKVRCMQIIAELEQYPRLAYTGSFGYINRDGDMDFNILIRSMIQAGKYVSLRAGAGIVADSDPRRELAETRAKAMGMIAALA